MSSSEEFNNLVNLISVRNYIAIVIESGTIEKKVSHALAHLLPDVDKMITSQILSDQFREVLGLVED